MSQSEKTKSNPASGMVNLTDITPSDVERLTQEFIAKGGQVQKLIPAMVDRSVFTNRNQASQVSRDVAARRRAYRGESE